MSATAAAYVFPNATVCYPVCDEFIGGNDFLTCTEACAEGPLEWTDYLPDVLFTVVLVMFSAMFSGLTLGLLSLDIEGLELIIAAGEEQEKKYAQKILPLRKRGNLLLCTLLLGNTLVNAQIAITSASITSGVVGGLVATIIIVIFGEISPQAICSRHGLRIGASTVFIVRPLMFLFFPITFPISRVLDYFLGAEIGTVYSRQHLHALLDMEVKQGAVTQEDQMLLSSALRFTSKVSSEIMTPLKEVFMISVTDNLDFDKLKDIYTSGYTRIPVYHNRKDCIVGIVFTKDLILVDPSDEIPVASILPFCSRSLYAAPKGTSLEKLLAEMQASRSHLYFVTEAPGAQVGRRLARVERVLGIVTMEDLIETLISIEIIDETDEVEDLDGGGTHQHSHISWRKIKQNAERRLEFFEMIQRRDEMLANGPSAQGAGPNFMGGERPTPQEVRALASYLSNNVPFFRPPHWSIPMLRRLLNRSSISTITDEDVERGRYVYVRGVPASFCCLLLHGQLQIRAGNEGFASEIGPWTTLALPALEAPNYTPDFTARVECAARILIISRQEVLTVLGGALPNGLTSPATGLMGAMLGATPSGSAMLGATPSGKTLLDGSRSGSGRGSCVGTLPSSLALGPSGGSMEGLDSLDMRMNPDTMSARGEAGADSSGSEQLHDAEEM